MALPRVLIAHDDRKFVQLVTQFVEELGYQACMVSDIRRFQSVYQSTKPQLILYELITEDFDGIELTRWLIEQ